MDVQAYFRSLTDEFEAVKHRVRNFIEAAHWQTDGEWKESVLRAALRRHLPSTVAVGRGFIVAPERCSRQIDVLLYDSGAPMLYREGDLAFVTPDAVRGIIEVKATARPGNLAEALAKLADNWALASTKPANTYRPRPFAGLFAYDVENRVGSVERVLDALQEAAGAEPDRAVPHVALGRSNLAQFWVKDPHVFIALNNYWQWHLYDTPDSAFGHFLSTVVRSAAETSVEENRGMWFPAESKELQCVARRSLVARSE